MPAHLHKHVSVAFRSAVFHLLSGVVTLLFLVFLPLVYAPMRVSWAVFRVFIGIQLFLLRAICGQSYRVKGLENLPNTPVIFASRHEAMWETFFLPYLLQNPAVFLKDEILKYPVAGAVGRAFGHIGVDRSGSLERIKEGLNVAQERVDAGRSILIFPGGSRNPELRDRVQSGVAVLYRSLNLPCVPITLDSGRYWPFKSWLRYPGEITVEICPIIQPSLRTKPFLERLSANLAGHGV